VRNILRHGLPEAVGDVNLGAAVLLLGDGDLLHEQLHKLAPLAARLVSVGLHFCKALAQREEPCLGGGGGQSLLLVGGEVGFGGGDEEL
jgi:hypothetical protein